MSYKKIKTGEEIKSKINLKFFDFNILIGMVLESSHLRKLDGEEMLGL